MEDARHDDRLYRIGWRGPLPTVPVARVVAQHRAGYELHDGTRVIVATSCARLLRPELAPASRPAVGDFVRVAAGDPAQILEVLERRTCLRRAAAGERHEQQIIATNIDYVLVLTGLDADFNPRRIERYLLLVEGSGARAVVLLGKIDACADGTARLDALRARLPETVPIHAIDSTDPATRRVLAPYLGRGDSAVLVGSSGAGKSTLTNTLLGTRRMATAVVRATDGRGRHTTTHRALILLPSGGCLIDTPGMRELKFTGEERLDAYGDIQALARGCRFADCRHGAEPGCAVRAALAAGELDASRWEHYLKLRDEREEQALRQEIRRQRRGEGHRPRPGHDRDAG